MNIPLFWMGPLHDQNDFPGQSRNIDTKTVTKRLVGGQNQWRRVLNTTVLFLGVFYPSQRSSTSLDLSHLNRCFLILLPLILFMLKIYYGYAIVQVYLLKPGSTLVYIYLYLFGNYRRKNLTQIFLTETIEHFLQLLILHRLPKTPVMTLYQACSPSLSFPLSLMEPALLQLGHSHSRRRKKIHKTNS